MSELTKFRLNLNALLHAIVGGLIGGITILFMYFIVWDLDDPIRFAKFTASQHPNELPLTALLYGIVASFIYWGLVGLFKLIKRRRKD